MVSGVDIAFLAFALALGQESRSPTPQDPAPTVVEDVIVNARPLSETAHAFVDEVTQPPRGRGPARWHHQVCVGAVNLRADAAQVLIDRVSAAALSVGLQSGEPGCSPNIVVIATDDAAGLTRTLVESRPRTFFPGYSGASQSRTALQSFVTSTLPVRWWTVSMPVDRDTGQIAVRLPGQTAPMIAGSGRLTTNVTNRLMRTFVILDITRMENVTFQQVGDYVAMVSLAQINPDAETAGFDTVLNLFDTPAKAQFLTDWDRSYLGSLYGVYMNQRQPNAQMGAIASSMTRDRRNPAPSPDTP